MNKRVTVKDQILSILVVMLPFIIVATILFLNGNNFQFSILSPVWNDEIFWWRQVDALLKYGKPLGYFGWHGTHASIGTWGSWGPFPILPYAIWGKLFGWKLYSMALANLTFLSLSMLSFLVLAKPNQNQKIWLIIAYCCSPITVVYSMTSMTDGLHYSIGIFLISLLIWIERRSRNNGAKNLARSVFLCFFIAVLLFYFVTVYLIFALVVPLFCWYLLFKLKPVMRAGVSIIVTGLVAVSASYLVSLFSAPYMTSTWSTIIQAIKERGIYEGFCFSLDNLFNNLVTVDLPNMLGAKSHFFWFFVIFLILLSYLVYDMCANSNKIKERIFSNMLSFVPLWCTAGFLLGYCALYTGYTPTLCRGLNTGLVMALVMLIHNNKNTQIMKILVVTSLLAIVSTFNYYQAIVNERAAVAQEADAIITEYTNLTDVILLTETDDPWENTVANYGEVDYKFLSLPAGCGINWMNREQVNEQAKYAIVTCGDKKEETIKQMLVDHGHCVIYEDVWFTVLMKDDI